MSAETVYYYPMSSEEVREHFEESTRRAQQTSEIIGEMFKKAEVKIWNEAIDAFAQRLMRYYQTQRDSSLPAVVEYHIKQIANDMKRKDTNEKD